MWKFFPSLGPNRALERGQFRNFFLLISLLFSIDIKYLGLWDWFNQVLDHHNYKSAQIREFKKMVGLICPKLLFSGGKLGRS